MKQLIIGLLLSTIIFSPSCNTVKNLLTASDAEAAIREALSLGSQFSGNVLGKKGAISKETILSSLFPVEVQKVLNTLQTLGLSKEVDRFSGTLTNAAASTAERSVPIFLMGIKKMNIRDAISIVKNGGTACTDYLRATVGDTLRHAISPTMNTALEEYKLVTEWNKMVAPAKLFTGDKLNLDLGNLMSGLVANLMFAKIAEKEMEIRTKAEARTSTLLQNVFGKVWNK